MTEKIGNPKIKMMKGNNVREAKLDCDFSIKGRTSQYPYRIQRKTIINIDGKTGT